MGIEAAVNLAAMFIHFRKQKAYIVSATNRSIAAMNNMDEQDYNDRMTGGGESVMARQSHC
jgi:hypothetical protein